MAKQPESHYNLNKLHLIFACVTIVLLVSIGSMFLMDYLREWKDYQAQFRVLEIEKTRVKYDLANNKLQEDPQYQALIKEIDDVSKSVPQECHDLSEFKKELTRLNNESDLETQKLKFIKAQLDAAKYRFEEARAHSTAELSKTTQEYNDLDQKYSGLNKTVTDLTEKINQKTQLIFECEAKAIELQRKKRTLSSQLTVFERKLNKIDPNQWGLINRLADMIRDLPVIDMANPNSKIQQVVLKNITDDVNFQQVPKVERCTSCHLGITNTDYQNAAQPFKTHPNLELFLGTNSAHPLEEFGCTVCHGGRDRGTSFLSVAHTPSSEKQKEEWIQKYGWQENDHWDDPMLPKQYTQAGCFKCHSAETVIKGAEKLNLGLNLIERAGCYNCHTITKYKDWPKTGPDLTHIASKLSRNWAYKWIENPRQFRFDTWMPSFYQLSNNSDPESLKRGKQEIHAIVSYLFANSIDYQMNVMPEAADAHNGEELVSSLGCFACHQIEHDNTDQPRTRESLRREHGPNLIGLGSKTNSKWIYNWLKDPNRYHPQTRMPNLRLSDQEAADIAAYLSNDTNHAFDQVIVPLVNNKILNQIVHDFLVKLDTPKVVGDKLSKMNEKQKLIFAGEKLIGQYGCNACHNIKGFENAKPIGTELTEEGNKPADKLDFGFIHIEHTKEAWFSQKLKDPRIFDQGRVKAPDEKLKMPDYHLTQEEVESVTTALLGFVKDNTVTNKQRPRTPENLSIEEGEKIVRQFNCQGCHMIEGDGGTIKKSVEDWLVKYQNRSESEASAVVNSFSPPDLTGEGKKVQTKWLFEFLHQPTPIRPWLKIRMPTYTFNAAHLNTLVKYFSAVDKQEFPFDEHMDVSLNDEELKSAEKLFSDDYFGCAKCHIVGDKMPSGSADSWAPNFALTKSRLKTGWVSQWLKNPNELQPGTKMPTYFDPASFDASGPEDILKGDENEQIRVLRNYLMTISDHPVLTQSNQAIDEGKTSIPISSPPLQSQEPLMKTEASPQADAKGQTQ